VAHAPQNQSAMALMFKPYRDYGIISGRSRRKEYWLFVVFCVAAYFPLGWLEQQPHLILGYDRTGDFPLLKLAFGAYSLLPFLCVTVRRLHDTGRSGWWTLLYLVPFLGWVVLLYFMVLEGDEGLNQYGPSPMPSTPPTVA
jgi:uncharacterized membrane protein YhaH (DUF805 family)